ncbi:SUKH-4 family immunity protein [Kitasatospora sp. DSM 101779]|uniref:SUKH-4 family immunity protein n=1 Tax=Kitasatospora sp. DSM 101779 TaxID=2853165 RepID=UPI0021D97922|nr:SUKH-4 family immunity protein [Kitasatospora sp. DSM 101779]MCU7825277.1 SUKH-4 family immunity protein [Kitasatospora sp. DSM 101779]
MTNDDSSQTVPVTVDCAGRSLEAVIAAAVRAAGAIAPDVALQLERVESAGPLTSSEDQERIASWVREAAFGLLGRRVSIAAPAVADRSGQIGQHELPADPDELLWLAAAAALEPSRSSLDVWRAFAAALTARPVPIERLTEFAGSRPEISLEGRTVGFVDRAVHRAVRARLPLNGVQQRALHRVLVELRSDNGDTTEAVAAYLHAAWPVHAALAGELEEWLSDPDFLVESGWYGLGLGLSLAYPEGVPLGSVAGDLHCVLLEGLAAPASHEEWLSWVHHALVGRGLSEAAQAVAARVRLPWRTVWSRWQWPSGYAPRQPEELAQDELCLVNGPDGPAVATRRESQEDWGTVFEQLWDVRTGEKLGGVDTEVHENVLPREKDLSGRTALHTDGEWSSAGLGLQYEAVSELPWAGESVEHAVQCTPSDPVDGTMWVFMGRCGLFGALVHDDLVAGLPQVPRGWYGHGVTPRAQWPAPDVSLTGPLSRTELEQDVAFGAGACRPVAPELLPDTLEHSATREFLTEVGWPEVDDPALSTVAPTAGGLVPVEGRPHLLEGLGDFRGDPLLLDGRTGAVFCEDSADLPSLMASGLPELLRIVLLHRVVLSVPVLLGVHDSVDLEQDVARWIGTVDPAAAEGGFWEHTYFSPSLIELWEEGPE